MNAGQWQDLVLLMLLAPTLMAVMSALATVGTLEMAHSAQVQPISYTHRVLEGSKMLHLLVRFQYTKSYLHLSSSLLRVSIPPPCSLNTR